MAKSQNGYPANDRSYIASYTIPGTKQKMALRKGDVSFILLYVAEQFHNRVEKLVQGWNWAYAERPIRGGTALSNHASGTGIDLNAPLHPLGKRGTFSRSQVAEVRKILDEVGGVVRWGEDYKTRADGMHFEIIAGSVEVSKAASKIRNKTVGAPVRNIPSPNTPRVDRSLRNMKLKVDGIFGYNTIRKLQWQIGNSHTNGTFGRDTVRRLESYLSTPRDGTLGRDTVRALQRKIGVEATGIFGRDSVRALQRWLNA